jgi:DNA polymerase III subunit delta'
LIFYSGDINAMFFKDIVGQDSIIKQLTANVTNNRLSHAQLFLGPEGSGHIPLALALSRYILCKNRGDQDACGVCPSCIKMKKLEHPDLHFFFPTASNQEHKKDVSSKLFYSSWRELASKTPYFSYIQWLEAIGIENKQAIINAEDCNEIIRTLGLKSYESPYKIVLIYMVEKLFHAAAPKLLKILEEPPNNTIFIMVSENKEQVLNTIMSRAQILRIPKPSDEEIENALKTRYSTPIAEARQIAFLASGNYTEAVQLVSNNVDAFEHFEQFRSWMRLCFKGDLQNIIRWVESNSKVGREKQKSFLSYGLKVFRLCLINNYKALELLKLSGEEKTFLEGFSPFVNHHNSLEIIDSFNQAMFHIERNANPKILFADLSITLVKLLRSIKT